MTGDTDDVETDDGCVTVEYSDEEKQELYEVGSDTGDRDDVAASIPAGAFLLWVSEKLHENERE